MKNISISRHRRKTLEHIGYQVAAKRKAVSKIIDSVDKVVALQLAMEQLRERTWGNLCYENR